MSPVTAIIEEITAALEREPTVNLHSFPLKFSYLDGALVIEGETEDIRAKKRTLEVAAAINGITGIVDRLRVTPAERMADGEIRDHVLRALSSENLLGGNRLVITEKGEGEVVRGGQGGWVNVEVADGVVVLNGALASLSAKRLAGVLAWWVPGSRDVVNGIEVDPPEEDTDDEVVDAVRLVLEKDPFVNASQVRVRSREYTVTLEGMVRNETERQMAEADCWYVFRVNRVENLLRVAG